MSMLLRLVYIESRALNGWVTHAVNGDTFLDTVLRLRYLPGVISAKLYQVPHFV